MNLKIKLSKLPALLLLSAIPVFASDPVVFKSPSGLLEARLVQDGGQVEILASFSGAELIGESPLGLKVAGGDAGPISIGPVEQTQCRETWKPAYGEFSELADSYNGIVARLEGGVPGLALEARAYDHALAFRYRIAGPADGGTIRIDSESTVLMPPAGARGWPIRATEGKYAPDPVPLADIRHAVLPPFTFRTDDLHASILEADTRTFPRMIFAPSGNGGLAVRLGGDFQGGLPFVGPWRVILVGKGPGDLLEARGVVETLNPPAEGDYSWVRIGKTLSAVGNFPVGKSPRRLETDHLKGLVDWASENNFAHLQIDWGWNGTEGPWTPAEVEAYRPHVPAAFRDSGWEANTTGDLRRVAKGYVPYRPNPKTQGSDLIVDLDVAGLATHAKSKGVGLSLYANARWALENQDKNAVLEFLRGLGVEGVKPGFVHYGTQRDAEWQLDLVRAAAERRLLLNIHDEYVPDGSSRTFPHILSTEGGAGAENKPGVDHDLALPFTRHLAGPFDYTPFLFSAGRSNMHQLALMTILHNPSHVVRGGFSAWQPGGRGGEEIEFLRELPDTWDETRVLDAVIGRHAVVARRQGDRWFLAAATGSQAWQGRVDLGFLPAGRWKMVSFSDVPGEVPERRSVRSESIVDSPGTLGISLLPAGGFGAILVPACTETQTANP